MPCHSIEITRKLKEDEKGNTKTEIWAKIRDTCTGTSANKLIWWEDKDGTYHDASPDLSIEIREAVDNAWIEKSRKW